MVTADSSQDPTSSATSDKPTMATKVGRERGWEKTKSEEGILLHLAGKPTMAMKDGGQNVIENEEQDDFGGPVS